MMELNAVERMIIYNIKHDMFYKYMFKCIENEKIKVLFYCNNKNRFLLFQNISKESEFTNLFHSYINKILISKDNFIIEFINGSQIKFLSASDNSRGHRGHYAIVDKEIDIEKFYNIIEPQLILFDIDKRLGKIKDNYNIEFIDM